jgi:uncharacterized protein YukE
MQPKPRASQSKTILALLFVVLVWGFVAFLFLQRQAVYDWWRLRGYTPSSDVAALADQTTMKDNARHVFYVYHPAIESSSTFNEHCRDGEFTIVLGCYSQGRGIYIFRVDDPRLDGIEEVTAAHEFLHAAYDRLSKEDRKKVDILTAEAYADLDNERIKETVEEYRKHDASVVPNELHSILGTEVADLPPELEEYYARYFTNRKQIVEFSEAYESAFTDRKNQAKEYESQLASLKDQVESANKDLGTEHNRLEREADNLQSSRNGADPDTFNDRVNTYNADVNAYNLQVSRVENLVDTYNEMYAKYKELIVEQQDLFKAIDSRPQQIK